MAEKKENKNKGAGKFLIAEELMKKYGAGSAGESGFISSTSLLLEGVHFSLVYFPLSHLGYKAAISAIAGIYSGGAIPEQLTLSIAIGTRHNIDDIETDSYCIRDGIVVVKKDVTIPDNTVI